MNAPFNSFTFRTENCGECGGSGTRMGASDNDITCYDCSGEGSWNASCAECGEERPLNDDGVCVNCCDQLTETIGDPLLNRRVA